MKFLGGKLMIKLRKLIRNLSVMLLISFLLFNFVKSKFFIKTSNVNLIEKYSHIVRFSDLDHNHHMNNTNYAPLIANALENKNFTHFEINYLNECIENYEIKIMHTKNSDGEYIIGKVDDKTVFSSFLK